MYPLGLETWIGFQQLFKIILTYSGWEYVIIDYTKYLLKRSLEFFNMFKLK